MTEPDRIWINDKWEAYLRPTFAGDTSGYVRADIAALPAREVKPPFYFDRYINGVRMAEDVCVERETTLEGAMRVATRIAAKGPNGEPPVLVYRTTDAAHVNETPKSEHDAGNVLTAAQAREAALKKAAQLAYEVWDDPEALAKAILALIGEARA